MPDDICVYHQSYDTSGRIDARRDAFSEQNNDISIARALALCPLILDDALSAVNTYCNADQILL